MTNGNMAADSFGIETGFEFIEFAKKYNKECMAPWRDWIREKTKDNRASQRLARRQRKHECVCHQEKALGPNALQVEENKRLDAGDVCNTASLHRLLPVAHVKSENQSSPQFADTA